ncbi:MAG: poly-gamma-glutamate system protein [Clostridia bacterium]|nr:poly-gamma-glutamate system protein [Clostridia bacterium]
MDYYRKHPAVYLLLCVLLITAAIMSTIAGSRSVPDDLYDIKLAAAEKMELCMARIRAYKEEAGLQISPEDTFQTGMIGESYTYITTTLGAVEAKRTSANPDMAALAVELLHEAGVRPGQTVGAGFSGSWPALNIAVLCACEAMQVRCVYIVSVGASTYGANQPELTAPDIFCRLSEENLLPAPLAITPGGAYDVGQDMDSELLHQILTRLEPFGIPIYQVADYEENIRLRMHLYAQTGPIDCFVGVGGNVTTLGKNGTDLGQGVIHPDKVHFISSGSSLLERYCAQGLPVIHFLNIKKLVADYGLPYDPEVLSAPGSSAVYFEKHYSPIPAVVCLILCAVLLIAYRTSTRQYRQKQADQH